MTTTTARTMNELAALGPTTPANLPAVTGGASSALALMTDYANTVRQVEAFVNALVDTPFVPESHWPLPVGVRANEMPNRSARMKHRDEDDTTWHIRRQIACASATGAVLTGLPLGLDPLVALAQVFIVKGRPGLYTKIKLALAQARGHDAWDVERSDERVTCGGRRKGWPEDRFVEITVTMQDAERAGWTANETYEKTPADMLWSRAMSRVLDRVAADVLFGIASIEDLELDDVPTPDRASSVTVTELAKSQDPTLRAGSEKLRSLLGPVRDVDEAQAAAEDAPSPPIEQTDWRRLMSRFNELGVNGAGRDVRRLRVMSAIVGRPINRGSDLTKGDAELILDNLAGDNGAEVVSQVLGFPDSERRLGDQDSPPDPAPGPVYPPAAAAYADRQDPAPDALPIGDADPDGDPDVPEPTPDETRPAGLAGVTDPWGPPGTEPTLLLRLPPTPPAPPAPPTVDEVEEDIAASQRIVRAFTIPEPPPVDLDAELRALLAEADRDAVLNATRCDCPDCILRREARRERKTP